jgi:hypothetical protein
MAPLRPQTPGADSCPYVPRGCFAPVFNPAEL